MNKLLHRFAIVCLMLLSLGSMSLHANEVSNAEREYGIKAGFMIGFSDFVKWSGKNIEEEEVLKIGVIGNGTIEKTLKEISEKALRSNRKVNILHFDNIEQIEAVHIIFVSARGNESFQKLKEICKLKGILSVSDVDSFSEQGGMIEFVKVKNRIKFKINLEAVREANLDISSKLLRLSYGGKQ